MGSRARSKEEKIEKNLGFDGFLMAVRWPWTADIAVRINGEGIAKAHTGII
jgi:hypothetical protein